MNSQLASEYTAVLIILWDAHTGEESTHGVNSDNYFSFEGWTHIAGAIRFEIWLTPSFMSFELTHSYWCALHTSEEYEVYSTNVWENARQRDEQNAFVALNTDEFRKRCWLSGAPVECSGHERTEWIEWAKARGVSDEQFAMTRQLLTA